MSRLKHIYMVLFFVIIIAITITITRSEFVIQMNRNSNSDIIDIDNIKGKEVDKNIFINLPIEKYLIIYDSADEKFIRARDNFEKVLDYINKEYDTVSTDEVTNLNKDADYNAVILILEDINRLKNVDSFMQYVFEGGNIFFSYRLNPTGAFYNISRKLGIIEFGELLNAEGIRLLDNILIKGKDIEITEEDLVYNSSMSVRITEECDEYAETMDGTPLLWKKKYGQGQLIYFNGSMLQYKRNRGIIVGTLGLIEDDFIYPVINVKISFIDDFPAPIPQGTDDRITQEYGRTIPRFYKDVWWPDMLELAMKYSIKYTGVIIGTYNDEVEHIKQDSIDINARDFIYYGRELISSGGELGIHGYNHQPFFLSELVDQSLGYKPWKDAGTMIDGIEEVNEFARKTFPNYAFRVYVPPSNILYPEGRQAILDAETDIQIISSLYATDGSEDAYEQEFEVSDDGIIEFPRLTYGYSNLEENRWMMLNGITSMGIFSHFIHPDDVLDHERSDDKGWSQLLKEYDEFNKLVFNDHRWLRGMTASDGVSEMIKYLMCETKYDKQENYISIYCDNIVDSRYFILRTRKQIKSTRDCTVKKIDDNAYLVEVHEPVSQINFER